MQCYLLGKLYLGFRQLQTGGNGTPLFEICGMGTEEGEQKKVLPRVSLAGFNQTICMNYNSFRIGILHSI